MFLTLLAYSDRVRINFVFWNNVKNMHVFRYLCNSVFSMEIEILQKILFFDFILFILLLLLILFKFIISLLNFKNFILKKIIIIQFIYKNITNFINFIKFNIIIFKNIKKKM